MQDLSFFFFWGGCGTIKLTPCEFWGKNTRLTPCENNIPDANWLILGVTANLTNSSGAAN